MLKIVLDTNVVVSGLLFPGGTPDKIVHSVLSNRFQNATSPDLLTELRRVFTEKFSLPKSRLDSLVQLVSESSEIVYPTERLAVLQVDEADNRVLECAVTARADRIISGDKQHLLKLKRYEQIYIVSPADFIQEAGIV